MLYEVPVPCRILRCSSDGCHKKYTILIRNVNQGLNECPATYGPGHCHKTDVVTLHLVSQSTAAE
jgi:hypothetical protein